MCAASSEKAVEQSQSRVHREPAAPSPSTSRKCHPKPPADPLPSLRAEQVGGSLHLQGNIDTVRTCLVGTAKVDSRQLLSFEGQLPKHPSRLLGVARAVVVHQAPERR